jgi:hypothetical protein
VEAFNSKKSASRDAVRWGTIFSAARRMESRDVSVGLRSAVINEVGLLDMHGSTVT